MKFLPSVFSITERNVRGFYVMFSCYLKPSPQLLQLPKKSRHTYCISSMQFFSIICTVHLIFVTTLKQKKIFHIHFRFFFYAIFQIYLLSPLVSQKLCFSFSLNRLNKFLILVQQAFDYLTGLLYQNYELIEHARFKFLKSFQAVQAFLHFLYVSFLNFFK